MDGEITQGVVEDTVEETTAVVEETTEEVTPETTATDDEWSAEDEQKWLQEQLGEEDVTSIDDVIKKYKELKSQGAGVTKQETKEDTAPSDASQNKSQSTDPLMQRWLDASAPPPVMSALREKFGPALDKPEMASSKQFIEAIDRAILEDRKVTQQLFSEVASFLQQLKPVASETGYKQLPEVYQKAFPRPEVEAFMAKNGMTSYEDAVAKMAFRSPNRLKDHLTNGSQQKTRPANFGTQGRGGGNGNGRKPITSYFDGTGAIPKDSPFWTDYGKDAMPAFMNHLRKLNRG